MNRVMYGFMLPSFRILLLKQGVCIGVEPLAPEETIRQAVSLFWCGRCSYSTRRRNTDHSFAQAGGIDHVMYPEYIRATADEILKERMQHKVITVPIRLKKRLDKKMEEDSKKYAIRQRILQASRAGSQSKCLIRCKNPDLNHYHSQTYARHTEIPLASRGWTSRKSASRQDYFTIQPSHRNFALLEEGDPTTFEDLGLSENVVETLANNGLKSPTTVQKFGIEALLQRKHCIIASETGSGKTLTYLLPIFEFVLGQKKERKAQLREGNSPLALILLPTRELADQVHSVTKEYSDQLGLDVKLLQGGHLGAKIASPPKDKNVDILISTVNVIKELSKAGIYSLKSLRTIVLDEADTLLDDSFSLYVMDILRTLTFSTDDENDVVQFVLVSATMPRGLHTTLDGIIPIDDLHHIRTSGLNRVMAHVPQKFLRLRKMDKPEKTLEIAKARKIPLMIFCNRNETCKWLTMFLLNNNIPCIGLTGKLEPAQRAGRIDKYKTGETHVLVCTDLASRGIDTTNTEHVLNYDFPPYLADYIHRCGRTGRVGSKKSGKVTNFVANGYEIKLVQTIETSVRKQIEIENVNANIKRLIDVRISGVSRMQTPE